MKKTKVKVDRPGEIVKVVEFKNEGEEKKIIGVVEAREKGDYYLSILAHHKKGNNHGKIIIRGIAEGGARIKVRGEIVIEEKCSMVDDFMDIKVLILDDKSSASVDPRLEIKCDNVKASHSASVSMIDRDQLKYLSSRGLNTKEAKTIIARGFLDQVEQ